MDVLITNVLERQHGVVARRQLLALGLSEASIDDRVRAGRLLVVHRGVYAVGHRRLTLKGRWMAATLALGEGAVLSHRDAAALWGLLSAGAGDIHVTVSRGGRKRREGIRVHRSGTLSPAAVTVQEAIPVTTVARTLVDLGDTESRRTVERAADESERLRLFDLTSMRAAIAASPGRRGAAVMGAILAEHAIGSTLTRNDLEELFLTLCRRAGVPKPSVNAWVDLDGGGIDGDFVWRNRRLVIEVDGFATHGTRKAFRGDRRRDRRLRRAGWAVERFAWEDVVGKPGEVVAELREMF